MGDIRAEIALAMHILHECPPLRPPLFGVSGAIQHTAALTDARFIIAVNKNPNATMMKMADVAIVADANQLCLGIIKAIKKKIRD
jgi:electron transfer flavoprotein alpha subunit